MLDKLIILVTSIGILNGIDLTIDRWHSGRYAITWIWLASVIVNAYILWLTIRPPRKPIPRE